MKKIFPTALASVFLAGLGLDLKAESQVTLGNLQSSSITLMPGDTFTLDAIVSNPTGSDQLDSYDLQLSGDLNMEADLPAGIELTGFTDTLGAQYPDFPSPNVSTLSFSNIFQSTKAEPTIGSTPITLVTANFTALAPGDYMIYFGPQSTTDNPGLQDLFDPNGNLIPFTQLGTEVDVLPEPSVTALLGAGVLLFLGWRMRRGALV